MTLIGFHLKENLFQNLRRHFKFLKKKSLSVSSGTTGIELALKSLNLPKDSEVIMPVLTFASPVNAIINSNLKPVFVDINKDDFTIDVNQIEKKITKKTKFYLQSIFMDILVILKN